MLEYSQQNIDLLNQFSFVFLHGIRVRSGTNYLSKLMSYHPDIQLIPPGKTTDEFPLLHTAPYWESAFNHFVQRFNGNKNLFQFDSFAPFLGNAWLLYLIETFNLHPGCVFIKDPHVSHLRQFFKIFPNAKLIILIRDGRDNVASSIKAGMAIRAHMKIYERGKRLLKHLLLRDFLLHTREWANAARTISQFDAEFSNTLWSSRYTVVHYENIFKNPEEVGEMLFKFMDLPNDSSPTISLKDIPVIGSSFYSADKVENATKPNWQATQKTSDFQPIGRWKGWGRVRKNLFKMIAGKELISLGYERDMTWL